MTSGGAHGTCLQAAGVWKVFGPKPDRAIEFSDSGSTRAAVLTGTGWTTPVWPGSCPLAMCTLATGSSVQFQVTLMPTIPGEPDAEITLGMRPYMRGLVEGAPWYDELFETPKAQGLAGIRRQARALAERRCELAILLPNSLETALVAWMAGIPRRIGYRQGRSLLISNGPTAPRNRGWFSRRGPRRVPEPMPYYYGRLLDHAGVPGVTEERPSLPVTAADRELVAGFLDRHGLGDVLRPGGRKLVLFTAGASFGASKLWPAERFAAVARHFASRPDTVPVLFADLTSPIRNVRPGQVGAYASVPANGIGRMNNSVLRFPLSADGEVGAPLVRRLLVNVTDDGLQRASATSYASALVYGPDSRDVLLLVEGMDVVVPLLEGDTMLPGPIPTIPRPSIPPPGTARCTGRASASCRTVCAASSGYPWASGG